MLSNLDDIRNIDESISDIYSIQECPSTTYDKCYQQPNLDEIITISVSRDNILKPSKFEELKVKRTNEANEQGAKTLLVPQETKMLLVPLEMKKLLVPQESKPLHKFYGSTKHLFQKQLSVDISEETPFLLTVPSIQKEDHPKIPLPKHDSQESVQRIIAERRKLDENLKEISQYDIFEVTRNDSEEKLVDAEEQREEGDNESDSQC